ncbi:MAG: hypothetical protein ACLGHX_06115 [Acidimicrobiia bacterium]
MWLWNVFGAGCPPSHPTVGCQRWGGRLISLDDYLVTRLVELIVHSDDLAVSVGAIPPAFSREATGAVIDCLVGVARVRHGDEAVITALSRRERDTVNALRVL